jgi:hypothetical protein
MRSSAPNQVGSRKSRLDAIYKGLVSCNNNTMLQGVNKNSGKVTNCNPKNIQGMLNEGTFGTEHEDSLSSTFLIEQ